MTDQVPPHIAAFEQAARIYCARTGINPDATQRRPHPVILGFVESPPAWHTIAERMFDLQMLLSSMKQAALDAQEEQRRITKVMQ